jgi:hypothetical protein
MNKRLVLLSFCIPFVLGGGFQSLGIVFDRLAKPDTDTSKIILSGLCDWLFIGTILGLLCLGFTMAIHRTGIYFRAKGKK